jgi:predicted MFS family arabinose efflux permease
MAFGSPLGATIVPFVNWQGLFLAVGAAGAALHGITWVDRQGREQKAQAKRH